MSNQSQTKAGQIGFTISRQDAFSRCVGILDSMGEGWKDEQDVRKSVNKTAVALRDTQAPLSTLADYADTMKRTYATDSKAWAIMGCLANILRGGSRHGVN